MQTYNVYQVTNFDPRVQMFIKEAMFAVLGEEEGSMFNISMYYQMFIHDNSKCIFILEDGEGEIKGVLAGIKMQPKPVPGGHWKAYEALWYVDPDARGHGHLLKTAFEEWAIEVDCVSCLLSKHVESEPDKYGYRKVSETYEKDLL